MTTEYIEVQFKLTEAQMNKLANAHKNKSEVRLKLNKNLVMPNGGIPLLLTKSEVKKLNDGKSHFITISASRIARGGFLPALLAALPVIASVIGGVSGVTGIAKNIKDMVTKKGSGGEGLYLNPNPGGDGLYLNPNPGNGLTLNPGGGSLFLTQ